MVALVSPVRVLVFALLLTGCVADNSMTSDRRLPRLVRRRKKSRVTHNGFAEIQPLGSVRSPELVEHNGDGGSEGSATTKIMSTSKLAVIDGVGEVRFRAKRAATKMMRKVRASAKTPTTPEPSQSAGVGRFTQVDDLRIGDGDGQRGVVAQRETTTTDSHACRIRALSTTWGVKGTYFRVEAACITKVFGAIPDKTKVAHCIQGKHIPICKPIKIRMWPNPGKTYAYNSDDAKRLCYHGRAEFPTSQDWTVGDTIEKFPQTCRIGAISTKWFVKGTYFRVDAQCIKRVFGVKSLYKTKVTHCIQGQSHCKPIKINMWPNSGSSVFFPNDAGRSDFHGRSQFGSQVWQIGDTISPAPRDHSKAKARSPQTIHRGKMTGKVDSLWLFGAPVPSWHPLINELSPDGCFPGRRVYATTMGGAIDAASFVMPVLISKTNVMDLTVLKADAEHQFPEHVPANYASAEAALIKCYGTEDIKPSCLSNPAASRKLARAPVGKISVVPAVQGHMHNDCYFFNYSDPELLKRYAIARSYKTGCNCLMTYDGIQEVSRVVVRDPFANNDIDMAYLHQNVSSLKCFIVFRALDSTEAFLDKVQHPYPMSWCGMRRLSTYIVGELDALIKSSQWKTKIQDKLPKCNGVEVPGHSLGGAMASLLAACLNKKSWDAQTYDALLWDFEKTPQLLKPEPDARRCGK